MLVITTVDDVFVSGAVWPSLLWKMSTIWFMLLCTAWCKVEHELKLNHTEMSMIRWICGLSWVERKKSKGLRKLRIGTSQFDDQKE